MATPQPSACGAFHRRLPPLPRGPHRRQRPTAGQSHHFTRFVQVTFLRSHHTPYYYQITNLPYLLYANSKYSIYICPPLSVERSCCPSVPFPTSAPHPGGRRVPQGRLGQPDRPPRRRGRGEPRGGQGRSVGRSIGVNKCGVCVNKPGGASSTPSPLKP